MSKEPEAVTEKSHQPVSRPDAKESFVDALEPGIAPGEPARPHVQVVPDVKSVQSPVLLELGGSAPTASSVDPIAEGSVTVDGASPAEPRLGTLGSADPRSLGDHPVSVFAKPKPASSAEPAVSKAVEALDREMDRAIEHKVDEHERWIKNWRELKRTELEDPLLFEGYAAACNPLPKPFTDDESARICERLEAASGKSTEYAVRFSTRVEEACKKLGMSVVGQNPEYVIDHFIKVKLTLFAPEKCVEVNGERLTKQVTFEETVELIKAHHRAIHSADFKPEIFLRRLFDAYMHLQRMRSAAYGNPIITLTDCHRALQQLSSSQVETSTLDQPAPAVRAKGRPSGSTKVPTETGAQYSQRRPVRETAALLETRFRSNMSRLLAWSSQPRIDRHELVIHALRSEEGMSLIEPRSQTLVQYLTIEFRRVSSNAE